MRLSETVSADDVRVASLNGRMPRDVAYDAETGQFDIDRLPGKVRRIEIVNARLRPWFAMPEVKSGFECSNL